MTAKERLGWDKLTEMRQVTECEEAHSVCSVCEVQLT